MVKKFYRLQLCLLLSISVCLLLNGQSVRKEIDFDSDWKFHFGHAADTKKDFNFTVGNIFSKTGDGGGTCIDSKFNDSSWRTVQLPHDWVVELPFVNVKNEDVLAHGYKPVGGLFPETSIGWYRKTFSVSPADSGHHFSLRFDGIYRNASVWINNIYLGNNQSGYLGETYDITDFLNFRGKNVVVVRADASQYEGWFYEGAGIYRHVWLLQSEKLHIANNSVFVNTSTQAGKTIINVDATIANKGLDSASCTIQSYVVDRNMQPVGIGNNLPLKQVFPEDEASVNDRITLDNPHVWSPDDPYLYRVITLVKKGAVVVDSVCTRFGVRTIEIDAVTGLKLNGKPLKIKGMCNHQDHAGLGSALPDYLQYYRVQLLKEMGVNAYRTTHNAPTPELLDACDSLGLLVMDEIRLLNSGQEYLGQFERLVRRDRNHPSIFIWSIGNEEHYVQRNSVGRRIAQTMLARLQLIDPTRTATFAANTGNTFTGVNEVIPVRGFNYYAKNIDEYHRDHPTQPMMGTEMGSTVTTRGIYVKDSVRAYVPDYDSTYPSWATTAETWWKPAAERPWYAGAFVWTGFDYRGEPTPYEWPNINSHFGIMDMCGFPKNIYYYYQSWWSNKDVLHISPHWNWKGKEGKPVEVWINSNADNVELFLNGKSQGKKDMPLNGHLTWNVKYEPGKLQAIGYKANKKITALVETTGEAAGIKLMPTKKALLADGRDAVVVNIQVIDKQGREVPDAQNLVRFSIEGDAKIIGVGNGDPSSHEADQYNNADGWKRSVFNGKCQLILLAGKTASIVKVKAVAEGLRDESITIPSK